MGLQATWFRPQTLLGRRKRRMVARDQRQRRRPHSALSGGHVSQIRRHRRRSRAARSGRSVRAMAWLDDITTKPGFIARSIWSVKGDKGQRSTRGSGGLPAKWYPTKDGLWFWKGDTSSDEVNGH